MRQNHSIENVTASTINAKNGMDITVNVFYCSKCKIYFINYESLKRLIDYGVYPLLKFQLADSYEGELNSVSELMLYGYNVREGYLTETERRDILSWIIDSGLLTKSKIIKDLQFKINYNGKKSDNWRAKKKWEDDLLFVSQYIEGNVRKINPIFKRP